MAVEEIKDFPLSTPVATDVLAGQSPVGGPGSTKSFLVGDVVNVSLQGLDELLFVGQGIGVDSIFARVGGDLDVAGIVSSIILFAIRPQVVTFPKIQNVSTNRLLGRSTAGTGSVEEIVTTPFIFGLLDDTDTATAQGTLGLVIGTDVQAFDAGLLSIAGLTTSADTMIFTTASDTYATTSLTTFARSLLDDVDAATARTTLGLVIGTDVQAFDAGLLSIAGLTTAADTMIFTTASDIYDTTTLTTFARSLLDDPDATTALGTLGAAAAVHFHTTADIISGTFADPRIRASNVIQHVAAIDHNALLNFTITEHRTIDDSGTSTIDLLSAQKIIALVSAAAKGLDLKDSVETVATSNITLSGEQTINGISTSTSRVGVVGQSTASENGIYDSASGAWTRSIDADEDVEVTQGMTFIVADGDLKGNTYVLNTPDPIVVDTTALNFVELPRLQFGTTAGTAAEGNDSRIPTQDENDALVGTDGTPSSINPFVTSTDIGVGVQAFDVGLNSIAGLTTATDNMIFTTAADTYATTSLTAFARSILDDADAATVRTTISAAFTTHAGTHVDGGADEINGDLVDIDFTPANYTPDTSPPEANDVDDLAAHLKGIDTALASTVITNNFVFAHDITTQSISVANTFQDLTFATDDIIDGWTHGSGANFTCNQTATYEATIILTWQETAGCPDSIGCRALFDTAEIIASFRSHKSNISNEPRQLVSTFPFNGVTGKVFKVQISGTTTTVRVVAGDSPGSPTTNPSATISIKRIT